MQTISFNLPDGVTFRSLQRWYTPEGAPQQWMLICSKEYMLESGALYETSAPITGAWDEIFLNIEEAIDKRHNETFAQHKKHIKLRAIEKAKEKEELKTVLDDLFNSL